MSIHIDYCVPSYHFSVSMWERLYYVSTPIGSLCELQDGISGGKSSPKSQWMHCLFIEAMRELIPLRSARPYFDKTYPRSQAKHQSSRQELYQINTRKPLFHGLCYCSVLHMYALMSVDNVVRFLNQIRSFYCHVTIYSDDGWKSWVRVPKTMQQCSDRYQTTVFNSKNILYTICTIYSQYTDTDNRFEVLYCFINI